VVVMVAVGVADWVAGLAADVAVKVKAVGWVDSADSAAATVADAAAAATVDAVEVAVPAATAAPVQHTSTDVRGLLLRL